MPIEHHNSIVLISSFAFRFARNCRCSLTCRMNWLTTIQSNHQLVLTNHISFCIMSSPPRKSFSKLGLSRWLIDICSSLSIVNPTPIQQLAIPHILKGKNVVANSKTGRLIKAAFEQKHVSYTYCK